MIKRKKIFGNIEPDKLKDDLLRIAVKYNLPTVTRKLYKKKGRFAIRQYYAKFGSWNAALISSELMTWNNSCVVRNETREVGDKLRLAVFRRDNYKCVICGASPAMHSSIILHVDHVVPFSKGGKTEIQNLQTLCSKCNWGKSADTI